MEIKPFWETMGYKSFRKCKLEQIVEIPFKSDKIFKDFQRDSSIKTVSRLRKSFAKRIFKKCWQISRNCWFFFRIPSIWWRFFSCAEASWAELFSCGKFPGWIFVFAEVSRPELFFSRKFLTSISKLSLCGNF